MPYAVRWYVEQRVPVTLNWGELTVDEIEATNRELRVMLDNGAHPMHVLVDTRRVARIPQGFDRMLRAMKIVQSEPTFQVSIMVSQSTLLRFFGILASNLTRTRYSTAVNFAAANEILVRADPSLQGLLPDPEVWERFYDEFALKDADPPLDADD